MKKLPIVLILAGCSQSNPMESLLSEKKIVEDSLHSYRNSRVYFNSKFREATGTLHDTLMDSTVYYTLKEEQAGKRLKQIEYSIDSLGKLK